MFQYLLVVLAALLVIGGTALESLASSGSMMDYVVAGAVAVMLIPWLQGHFE